MKSPKYLLLILLLFLLTSGVAFSQVSVGYAEFAAGGIDAFHTSGFVIYSSVEIGGQFFLPYLEWSGYWGHWADNIAENQFIDPAMVSSYGHNLGTRVTFYPGKLIDHWVLPIGLFGGISHQFIATNYTDPQGYYPDYQMLTATNSIETGINAHVDVASSLQLCLQAERFFVLPGMRNRQAYTAGLMYVF
ncbi:MAG TPA: hypothetical protein VL633_11315 [Bacteroidota bacterium]|nr:hypothetical protein [Bacteroidota bacterium]